MRALENNLSEPKHTGSDNNSLKVMQTKAIELLNKFSINDLNGFIVEERKALLSSLNSENKENKVFHTYYIDLIENLLKERQFKALRSV